MSWHGSGARDLPVGDEDAIRLLPVRPFTALRTLELRDDPDASLAELVRVVEVDPVLSARVMRLANSAMYRCGRPVTSVERAVLLLGASPVQAMVAASAFRLLDGDVDLGPEGFWAHAVGVAAAASVAAPLLGVSSKDAFTAGLLHDIGTAVLHHSDPRRYARVFHPASRGDLLERERRFTGTDHTVAGADALARWGFPRSLVDAVREHHDDPRRVAHLTQAVIVGCSVAACMDGPHSFERAEPLERLVADLELPVRPRILIEDTDRQYSRIGSLVGVSG